MARVGQQAFAKMLSSSTLRRVGTSIRRNPTKFVGGAVMPVSFFALWKATSQVEAPPQNNRNIVKPNLKHSLLFSEQRFLSTASAESLPKSDDDLEDATEPRIVLYQYEPCPFCNKLRAYLDYRNIAYRKVEVDPLFKKELAFSKDYKKVPVCILDGKQQLNDSDEIIKVLSTFAVGRSTAVVKEGTELATLEPRWNAWVNSNLVHLLTANIYNTWDESIGTFDYLLTHGNFSTRERFLSRYVGAVAMFTLSKRVWNKKYNIQNPREELYSALDDWIEAVGENRFLGQNEAPTTADLGVFGVLRAIEAYPTFEGAMENSNIKEWYFRMKDVVGDATSVE
eukprot:m.130350 g.130350  ORF g.130350 m.130350 type:complete len:339 (-) comp29473_c0_seq4:85-1101(-)